MNTPAVPATPSTTQVSLQALLALVDDDREQQCAAILDEARNRAAAVRQQAHAQARSRMRQAFADRRQALQAQLAAAQARLATQQRLHAQQCSAAFLALAWQQLPLALRARWALPDMRSAWVARVLAEAHQRLPASDWRIVNAPGLTSAEQSACAAELAANGHADASFETDTGIEAGLKVVAGGNLIDGTQRGLLADRGEIAAALLRRLELRP